MAKLLYAASAENDLLEAWLYVAEASRLLDQPLMGRDRRELAPGIRSWPTSTPCILFYFPRGHDFVVARVLHHARDIEAIDHWPAH